jgi:lipid-A-disaccharide synthase-like uncharacterized protein
MSLRWRAPYSFTSRTLIPPTVTLLIAFTVGAGLHPRFCFQILYSESLQTAKQLGANWRFSIFGQTANLSHDSARKDSLLMRSSTPPAMLAPKPRPLLAPNELLHYLEEHKKLIVESAEAVREVSALLREMIFLLAAHDGQKHYQ